jgi:hypothetical protein
MEGHLDYLERESLRATEWMGHPGKAGLLNTHRRRSHTLEAHCSGPAEEAYRCTDSGCPWLAHCSRFSRSGALIGFADEILWELAGPIDPSLIAPALRPGQQRGLDGNALVAQA